MLAFFKMSSSLLAALLRAVKSYLCHCPNHGCEKLYGCFVVHSQPKEISKFVVRKTFYATRADIFFGNFRRIGSRCISALFVPKTGLSQIIKA